MKNKCYKYTYGVCGYLRFLLLKRKTRKTIKKYIQVRCIYPMKEEDIEYLESITNKEEIL